MVQCVDVAAGQAASGGDDVFGGKREVVDGAQNAAVSGLGHGHLLGIKIAQRIHGQAFGVQRGLGDLNGDGVISTLDLLDFLSVYGEVCPE